MKQIAGNETDAIHGVNGVTRGVTGCKFGNDHAVEELFAIAEGFDMPFVGRHHLFPQSVVLRHRTAVAPCVILLLREVEGGVGERRATVDQQTADMVGVQMCETHVGHFIGVQFGIFHVFQQMSAFVGT